MGSRRGFDLARRAREEFEAALRLKPDDAGALQSLAFLSFNEATTMRDRIERNRKLDDAAGLHRKTLQVDPQNKQSYYSLGVIAWSKFYPELMQARARFGLKPEDPGPLPDFNARQDLRNRLGPSVDDGIANLQKALEIDPAYDDAMAYMNLLIRERADLRDTPEEYRRDVELADEWIQKALDRKKAKQTVVGGITGSGMPTRIRVGPNVQAANLVNKVDPAYPDTARQARIQGVVRFNAVIGKDGHVQNLELLNGHPVLVAAAQDAVRQWVYKPTLLNGEAVDVVTTIDVSFKLP